MEGRRGRDFSRSKKPRETFIGEDSTGTEYWLVPFSESKVGNRKFTLRNCSPNKKVPQMLQGMITDAGTAERLFEKYIKHEKAKKKSTTKTTDGAKA
jgi:hypothetical protein